MSDVKINCIDCGKPFNFSERDQKYYEEKGFKPPKRCKFCRSAKKEKYLYREKGVK